MRPSRICNIDPPMAVGQLLLPRHPPFPVQLRSPPLRQPAKALQLHVHGVVELPPPPVRHVTRVHKTVLRIPVAVVVSVTQPWLPPQVMNRVNLGRVSPEELVPVADLGHGGIGPEVLQEVDPPRKPVPPDEHLIEEALVAAVVGDDVAPAVHEDAEGAVGGLEDHDARVEEGEVVAGGGYLWEVKEEVEVTEYDDVGVHEHDLVVVGELPEPELAVVVLVVGALLGVGVAYALYEADFPSGGCQGGALGGGDGVVDEDHEVAVGAGAAEALR